MQATVSRSLPAQKPGVGGASARNRLRPTAVRAGTRSEAPCHDSQQISGPALISRRSLGAVMSAISLGWASGARAYEVDDFLPAAPAAPAELPKGAPAAPALTCAHAAPALSPRQLSMQCM